MSRRSLVWCAGVAGACVLACWLGAREEVPARKFTLVYNVNNAGYIDVCGCKHKEVRQGSLTRRSSFLKQLRATGRKLLILDGGSSLFPIHKKIRPHERDEAIRKAELIVAAYNLMGYDAMAVGVYDLAAGLDTLLALREKAKFKFLSANLASKKTGKLYFEPHTVFEVGGVRVGVIGLTLETLSKPYLRKVAPDAKLLDPLEAAKRSIAELEDRTDLIIALSHLREETNFELAEKLRGLEILIDPYIQYGNHRTWIKPEEWVQIRNEKLFLRSDGQGARLGVVDIELVKPHARLVDALALEAEAKGDSALVKLRGENLFRFTRVSLEPHHLTDPEIDYLIEEWKKNIDPTKVRILEEKLPRDEYVTDQVCRKCHEVQYQNWLKTKHAHAYETLRKTNDHQRFDCVGCHTLAYGRAFLDTTRVGSYANVQCESCHGPNPKHVEDPKAHPYGKVRRADCIVCHNKEQTLKDFSFLSARRIVACPKG